MDMEKILGVVFSHPLQMLASLLLAGVSIQVLGARIEGTPLPKQRIILAFVVMVALAGCSTTTTITRNADGGETTTTKTSLGGASSSQCFRKVATDAAAGGVLGYLLDRKTGAQIGAGLGSLFGLAECGDDTPRAATGGQQAASQQQVAARALPARMNPNDCVANGLLKLVDSKGVARACTTHNDFFHGHAKSCQWSDQGGGVWMLAGAWGGNVTPRILQNLKDNGGHLAGCYGVR